MEPGQTPRIDGYTVTGLLGAGGAGVVHLAIQQALGREVALKILTSPHPTAVPRFQREAAAMSKISHPGLVRLYDHGVTGGTPWIAMEFLPGGSLRDRLGTSGPGLGVPAALRLARELLEVLAVLHDTGLLHRDIKPSNILMRESGQAVLADLGLVRADDSGSTRLTKAGQLIGTVAYLAPEALAKGELTKASDLFAVGAVLHEVLTGRTAGPHGFPADFQPSDPTAQCPDCPANLRDLVMDLMAGDPAKRPESAAAALRRLRETRKSRVPPTTPPARAARSVLVPAAVAGLLCGLGAFFYMRKTPDPLRALSEAPTSVTAHLEARDYEVTVSVFDAAGKPMGSRIAGPGPLAAVTIGGLTPGSAYTATVVRPGGGVLARREFTAAAHVRVHGLEAGAEPVLWMSANPTVTFTAGPIRAELGAVPRAVPLGRERGPFRMERPGMQPVPVLIKLPPEPPPADHKLGVCIPADRDLSVRELDGTARPVWDWVRHHDIRTVSLMPEADGTPALGADFISSLSRGGRVQVVPRIHPRATGQPGHQGFEAELDAPLYSGLGALALGVRFDWLTEGLDRVGLRFREDMGAIYQRWDPYLAAHHKHWRLVRGVQMRELMASREPLGPAIDPASIEEVEVAFDADVLRDWLGWTGESIARLRAGRLDSSIRSFTINFEREDDPREIGSERGDLSMIRQLVIARRLFPGATVTIDLIPRLMMPGGQLRPVWAGYAGVGRRLAGVDGATSISTRPGPPPSLTTSTTALAVQFTAGPRRLQVFFSDAQRAPATFTPARPGILRTLVPPSFEAGPPRFAEAAIELSLTPAPWFFEELLPVAASSVHNGVITVTP